MCERERAKHIDQNMHADAPASRAKKCRRGRLFPPYPLRLSRRRRGRRAKRGVGGSEEEEEEPGVTE